MQSSGYNMGNRSLPDIYTLALGPERIVANIAWGEVCVCKCVFTKIHIMLNFGWDECSEISLVWNQFIVSSCFEAPGVQRFYFQEICAKDWFCILPRMKKSMALFHIKIFSCHVTLLLKRKLQHVGHKWVMCGSHLGCCVDKMGQQMRPTFNPDKINVIKKVKCIVQGYLDVE